ncbi:MAG TPA: prepilin-type N-terminal cleavage/methylation domain-containing protein [bacterium]|nr:prepilin-type N-terminal cleavage/methylation domain-containing protein [bacterium]
MKISFLKNKAFTLVELLVTISIIALITTAITVSVYTSREKGRDVKRINDITQLQVALENYKKIEGVYPDSLTAGEQLIGSSSGIVFLDKIPDDSFSSSECSEGGYSYYYDVDTGKYNIQFCLENNVDNYSSGLKCALADGILDDSCDRFRLFAIAYTAGSNGSVTIENGLVTAIADSGYKFVKWSDNSTDNPRSDLTASTSLSITAEFASAITLLFHVPGNNSLVDVVSGLVAKPTNATSTYWSNPLYVLDPTDSSKYVLKKKVGSYYVPVMLGLPALETSTGVYPRFLFAANSVTSTESNTYKFLDKNNNKSHRLEFDIYVINNTNTRPFYTMAGLYNVDNQTIWNANSQKNGYEIGIYGSKITVAWRNNVSTTSYIQYATVSAVANKWVRFTVDISEVDSTHYNVTSKYLILSTGVEVQMTSQTLIKPGLNNRGGVYFFCDSYGYGKWAVNDYDYIRDIKIYELE